MSTLEKALAKCAKTKEIEAILSKRLMEKYSTISVVDSFAYAKMILG